MTTSRQRMILKFEPFSNSIWFTNDWVVPKKWMMGRFSISIPPLFRTIYLCIRHASPRPHQSIDRPLFCSVPFHSFCLSPPVSHRLALHAFHNIMLSSLRTRAAHPDPHSRSQSQPHPKLNRVIHDVHSITMTTPAVLTSRLRTTGQCPPSLLDTDGIDLNDEFLKKVSNLVQDGKYSTVVLVQSYVRRSLTLTFLWIRSEESLSQRYWFVYFIIFKSTGVKLGDNVTVEEFQDCMKVSWEEVHEILGLRCSCRPSVIGIVVRLPCFFEDWSRYVTAALSPFPVPDLCLCHVPDVLWNWEISRPRYLLPVQIDRAFRCLVIHARDRHYTEVQWPFVFILAFPFFRGCPANCYWTVMKVWG